ncbi:MAG: hypothetical protein JWN23_168 [Rhodocyclales bacterium]|nr:hypothetical protein [Rhodocyclales bacterium]
MLNVDAVHLFSTLWKHPTLADELHANLVSAGTPQIISELQVLPIGWNRPPSWDISMLVSLFGWFITASSALFGAPFWFDALQKLVNLRGTGKNTSPQTPTS